jgi:hypothetical protein
MDNMRFSRTLGLFLAVGLTGSSGGCGPPALTPIEQQKVEEVVKQERVGRHKELKEDLKAAKQLQANAQKTQAVTRKAALRGQAGP